MALPIATPAPRPSPKVVGGAFVQQYYLVLHQSPELAHRFYQDSSILSRPDPNGVMTSVTTTRAIKDKLLSFNVSNFSAEIETADSEASYGGGVFIAVTGSLMGNNVRRKFAQSFFLAPQDSRGYFVLNDIFRFVDTSQPKESNQMLANGTNDDAPKAPLNPDQEPTLVQGNHVENLATSPSEGDLDNGEEVFNSSESGGSGVEDKFVVDSQVNLSQSDEPPVPKVTATVAQDDLPKKSYASIVKVMKGGSTLPKPVYVPTTKGKILPASPKKLVVVSTAPLTPETPVLSNNHIADNTDFCEVEGHSIYIRNLPMNATAEQVEEEFMKFGPIRPGGVQVRNHKVERFCFGFVEFESLKSMQDAIQASPINFGGRQAYIEEKRTSTRVVNGVVTNSGNRNGYLGRGWFPPGRGGYRNDNFRSRGGGGFGGNNQGGYGRSDFRSRDSEYSGQGPSRHGGGEGYQNHQGLQNGDRTMDRHDGGTNQTDISA